jgi:hypothetical protein
MVLTELMRINRDGSSQGARQRPALQPNTALMEDRGIAEQLGLAQQISKVIEDVDDNNAASGNWSDFLRDLTAEEVAAFLLDPSRVLPERQERLRRPHLALFWTFLHLLGHVRDGLGGLTARHHDYHLRTVLRLTPEGTVPDEAFLLLGMQPRTPILDLSAGLAFAGGRDSAGRVRHYALTAPARITQARVAEIRTLCIEKDVIGLGDVWTDKFNRSSHERILFLLSLTYGRPRPGDELPKDAPGLPTRTPAQKDPYDAEYAKAVAGEAGWLDDVLQTLRFAPEKLFLQLHELRRIVFLAARRARETPNDQDAIDKILLLAAKKRSGADLVFPPLEAWNFDKRLEAACGGNIPLNELPDNPTLEELALQINRPDVVQFFTRNLNFFDPNAFVQMMLHKRAIDGDWAEVNGLLESAGQLRSKGAKFHLKIEKPDAMMDNLATALDGTPTFSELSLGKIETLENLVEFLRVIESWFALPGEALTALLTTLTKRRDNPVTSAEWDAALALLVRAHAERVYAEARQKLEILRKEEGLAAVLARVTDEKSSTDNASLSDRAASFLPRDERKRLETALAEASSSREPGIGWPDTISLLERAQRLRENNPPPTALRETWLALHPKANAAGDGKSPWSLFGDIESAAAPCIGFAISSPMLKLAHGKREISLSFVFIQEPPEEIWKNAFRLEMSTAEGWLVPENPSFKLTGNSLSVTATLKASDPALAPPPLGESLSSARNPIARLMLVPEANRANARADRVYDKCRTLRIGSAKILVTVTGESDDKPALFPLAIETDSGVVNGAKPFLPFGSSPGNGATMVLSHPEILEKELTSIDFHFGFVGAPKDIEAHFGLYGAKDKPPKVNVTIIDDGISRKDLGDQSLFPNKDGNAVQKISLKLPALAQQARPNDQAVTNSPRAWSRHLRLTLTQDFKHSEYPSLAAQKATALAIDLRRGKTPDGKELDPNSYVVPPPYTPQIKFIGLNYGASQHFDLSKNEAQGQCNFYHIHPFGHEEVRGSADPQQGIPFLPAYDDEGEMLIGIANAAPPQSLSLLAMLAPGTGDLDLTPPVVRWSILGPEGWQPLTGEAAPEDETASLRRNGLLRFALPATNASPRLPQGLTWLRASVAENGAALGKAMALHAQAVRVRLQPEGIAADHFGAALPAGSITRSASTVPGLARVEQPYPSFGGRAAEAPEVFARRAAERLRHRRRALTPWDYEHLVLARFPEVYKVKCLSARTADPPGLVRLIIIPKLDAGGEDPRRPRATPQLLADIRDYLAPLQPGIARLEVRNPDFVQVKVRTVVRFMSDRDPRFDVERLSAAISRFLSPWAFGGESEITIGARVHANSLVAFIDAQDYVDYVASVRLFISADGGKTFVAANDVAELKDDEDAILIAADRHQIDVEGISLDTPAELGGIGFMRIQLDFRVGETALA